MYLPTTKTTRPLRPIQWAALVAMLALAPLALAEEAPKQQTEAVPEPPPLPEKMQSGEVLEPDVTIIESDEQKIEQYSVNGHIYMVKITPKGGVPYYLVDTDGDGDLEYHRSDLDNPNVQQWRLFSW
jgi:hypothetical protein